MIRSVNLGMAVEAVGRCRRVLPQERAALLGVALIAGLVDGVLHQLRVGRRAVGIMAIGADHLALAEGMTGTAETLCPLVLMAGEADISLGLPGQDRVIESDGVMAADTGIGRGGMGTDMPVHPDIALRATGLAAFMA